MATLAKQIETLMKLRKITQADLAKKSGMHRANLCRYLAGDTDIRVTSLVSLLAALDVNCEEFLEREIHSSSLVENHLAPESIGHALEVLLRSIDPIAAKTLLKSLLIRTQNLSRSSELDRALKQIESHHLYLQSTSQSQMIAQSDLEFVEPS